MNKALHRFYLFALNRLSEARRGANRGLSFITSLINVFGRLSLPLVFLFFGSAAHAEDYWWAGIDLPGQPRLESLTAGCDAMRQDLIARFGSNPYYNPKIFYGVGIKAISPTSEHWKCTFEAGISNYFSYSFIRIGDGCTLPKVYNPTTGECSNDQQKGSCNSCPCAHVHDPINAAVGNSFQTEVDYPSSNLSTLHFTRAYNSLDGLWRHSYAAYLRFAANKLALVRADGRESFFTLSGSTVTAAPTELGSLLKTADGWLYTAENNERFTFDATGRLTRWTNAAGAEHLLSYVNGSVTVTDNLGQSLSFTEDAQHQPLTLSTAGLTIKYDYNANQRLSQLTRTRGGQTERRLFHYEIPNKPNLLTGITDERGVRYTTWTFDDQDRATSSEHAGGVEHGEVAYNADGSSTVTNEFGKKSIYRFVTIAGVKRVSAIEGEALGSCPMSNSTFTYDARGLLKTKTDNKGHLTTYSYNARGLEISRTEAAGTAQARTISTTWHATFNLPLTVTEPGRTTTYTYDAQGRQLSQTRTAL